MVCVELVGFANLLLVEKLTDTDSTICLPGNMRYCLRNKKDVVLFVVGISRSSKESLLWIILIKQGKSEVFYVQNAIQTLGYGKLGVL